MSDDSIGAHLRITGRVQGVFYRASTADEARRLGLTGWVRNMSDGSVEAQVEGTTAQVDELVDWCRRGPPSAVVAGVETTFREAGGEYSGFNVRY